MNVVIMEIIMSEKTTKLPPLRNQDLKTVKVEIKKINQLLTHFSTNNITEFKILIYAGMKLVCEKFGVP